MLAQSIVRNLLEDDEADESPQEAYDRIKRQVIANAYRSWTPSERVQHWVSKFKIPTPEEEPNASVRWQVTSRIPAERITRLLTPAEEPDAGVRCRVAYRIPAELLTRLLAPEEEPSAKVRRTIEDRLTAANLRNSGQTSVRGRIGTGRSA